MLVNMKAKEFKKSINTLIIGWNTEAATLYDRLLSYPALRFVVKGFIRPAGMQENSHYKNVSVIGDLTNLAECVETHQIEEVLIVLSPGERPLLSQILSECQKLDIRFNIVGDAYDTAYQHVVKEVIKETLSFRDFGTRRVLDFLLSILLLILLFPLFIFVALCIKTESPGPIFYTQQRCGKNGRIFSVYKFRSMVQDAEKASGPVWAQKQDPRITRVGKFMRKTRIDELPQLMNIFQGDMSFIGPRPERPFFVENFKKQIPMYINRLKIKPGVTGLAQVTVGYDETLDDVREKVRADIEYIENAHSLKMNLYILWKTIIVVLVGEGQ